MELLFALTLALLAAMWLGVVFIGPPYVPTLTKDLQVLLTELRLSSRDHVVDLGAGDGRVLKLVAATGAKASGVEINPMLVWLARWRLRGSGATVHLKDMWQFTLPEDTTHVFMFCAGKFMSKMDECLKSQLQPGQKITVISYGFEFSDKTPARVVGAFNIYEY